MMKGKLLVVALVVVVAVSIGAWFIHYRRSPEYAVARIASAIAEGNRLRFQAHVDLDRALPSAVDQLMGQALVSAGSSGTGMEALGAALGTALVDQLKPALVQTMRTAILESVERGSFDSLFVGPATDDVDLTEIGSSTGTQPSRFVGLTSIVQEGDAALMGLRFSQPQLDTVLVLQLRLERSDGTWMIVAPENLDALVSELETLQEARLTELRLLARERIREYVRLGEYIRGAERLLSYTMLDVARSMENISEDSITVLYATLSDANRPDLDEQIMLPSRSSLSPGESTSVHVSLTDIVTDEIPEPYLSGDLDALDLDVALVVGSGAQVEYVGPFSSWSDYERWLADPKALARSLRGTSVSPDDSDPLISALERAAAGPWIVSESTNPLDDSPIVTLVTQALSGRSSFGAAPSLVLRCRDNRTEVYINWNDYLGSDRSIPVTYRVGDAPMQRANWGMSTDNRATFFSGNHINLIRQMLSATRFVAQVTPYSESPVTAEFDLAGLGGEIAPLQAACGWS